PAEQRTRAPDVRLSNLRIVYWQRAEHDLAARAGESNDPLGQVEQRHLERITHVERLVQRSVHELPQALDEIGDVLERACLRAVSEDGDGLVGQRLAHERGNRAPVV